jgi:hypothetical protein
MSLWSVRLAFGAALVLAAATISGVLGRAPFEPNTMLFLVAALVALAFALRRGEAFAAWTLCGGCVVYGVAAVWEGSPLGVVALVGLLLAVFLWAGLQLQRFGVRVPRSETWARIFVSIVLLQVIGRVIYLAGLGSGRPDVAETGERVFEIILLTALGLGVWRRWPWAAYTLVAWEAFGLVLTVWTPAIAARHAVSLVLYAVGAHHVRKIARARRAANPSRRRSFFQRLSGRTG